MTVAKYLLWILSTGLAFAGAWRYQFTETDPANPSRRKLTASGRIALPVAAAAFFIALSLQVVEHRSASQRAEMLKDHRDRLERDLAQTRIESEAAQHHLKLQGRELERIKAIQEDTAAALIEDPERRRKMRERRAGIMMLGMDVTSVQAARISVLQEKGLDILRRKGDCSEVEEWEDSVMKSLRGIGRGQDLLFQYHENQVRGGDCLGPLDANLDFLRKVLAGSVQLGRSEATSNLTSASMRGDLEGAKAAIADGADVNGAIGFRSDTPLIAAVVNGREEVAKFLVSRDANVDIPDDHGSTPLIYAAIYQRHDLLRYLISRGAFVDAHDDFGRSALKEAALRGDTEVVRSLLDAGADPDLLPPGDPVNAVYVVAASPRCPSQPQLEVVSMLSSRGADCDTRSPDGSTPLAWAVQHNCPKLVEQLLKCGAQLDSTRFSDGSSYLEKAKEWEHREVVSLLEEP